MNFFGGDQIAAEMSNFLPERRSACGEADFPEELLVQTWGNVMRMFRGLCAVALTVAILDVGSVVAQVRKKVKPFGQMSVVDGVTKHRPGDRVVWSRTMPNAVVRVHVQTETKSLWDRTVSETLVRIHVETVRNARNTTVTVPEREWTVGVAGWFDHEGFNVEQLPDVRSGPLTFPSPLRLVKRVVNGRGHNTMLEPGDVIQKIGGVRLTNELDLLMAVQTAPNPRALWVEWVDCRTGQLLSGTVSAIRLNP